VLLIQSTPVTVLLVIEKKKKLTYNFRIGYFVTTSQFVMTTVEFL